MLAGEYGVILAHFALDERVPTRVRTGLPPACLIASTAARPQIALCKMVAPGLSFRSTRPASSEYCTSYKFAFSSSRTARSPSPSKATRHHSMFFNGGWTSTRFFGSSGLSMWLGRYRQARNRVLDLEGNVRFQLRKILPAMPLPASTARCSGLVRKDR